MLKSAASPLNFLCFVCDSISLLVDLSFHNKIENFLVFCKVNVFFKIKQDNDLSCHSVILRVIGDRRMEGGCP